MSDHEIAGIVDDIERGHDGDAWHGPPLRRVLEGVTPEVASARPIPGGHSIWEIVNHVAAWHGVVARRITEKDPVLEPEEGNFPPADGADRDAWDAALARLDERHRRLVQVIAAVDPARLRDRVPGKPYDVGHMARGVPQHLAYHAGQIALIRRLAGSPPP